MDKKLTSNIWKYATILVTNKRLFVAILGAYYLTIPDVTAQSIGIILLLGNLAGFIFEIPSGYFSDKMGHKQALVLSRALMLFSTVFYLSAESLSFLILGSLFQSLSFAFMSGTGSAFMHETLDALGREHEYTKVMGKIRSIGYGVPIVFTVLIPFFVHISYTLPFIISLVTDFIGFIAACTLITPPVSQKKIEEINTKNFIEVVKEGMDLQFFRYAIFGAVMGGILFGMSIFRAPYQVFLGVPVIYFGVFHGIGRVGASLLLAYSGKMKEKLTILSFYKYKILLFSLLIFTIAFVSNPWVVVAAFLTINAFQWGLSQINLGFTLEIIKGSNFKATLLSTKSQLGTLVGGITSAGLGFLIEKTSYQTAYLYLGIIFFVILVSLYVYIAKTTRVK